MRPQKKKIVRGALEFLESLGILFVVHDESSTEFYRIELEALVELVDSEDLKSILGHSHASGRVMQ